MRFSVFFLWELLEVDCAFERGVIFPVGYYFVIGPSASQTNKSQTRQLTNSRLLTFLPLFPRSSLYTL